MTRPANYNKLTSIRENGHKPGKYPYNVDDDDMIAELIQDSNQPAEPSETIWPEL